MILSTDEFFETIPGQPHTTLNKRVWQHPGCIVDVGCYGWDYCNCFLGKKRIIGVDPDLSVPKIDGAELMQAQIGPVNGLISFQGSTNFRVDNPNVPQVPMWSWKRFVAASITADGIAVLKLNIEGSEWPLLSSMDESDFSKIDQIAVSFHHFVPDWREMEKCSHAVIGYLESVSYYSREIYSPLGWWLFYKK